MAADPVPGPVAVGSLVETLAATVGCLIIVVAFCMYPQLRRLVLNRLVLVLTFGDLLVNVGLLLAVRGLPAGNLCYAQAVLLQWGGAMSTSWLSIIALYICASIWNRADRFNKVLPIIMAVCTLMPLTVSLALLVMPGQVYGPAGPWCWIGPAFGTVRFYVFIIPESLMTMFDLVVFAVAFCRLRGTPAGLSAAPAEGALRPLLYVILNAVTLVLKLAFRIQGLADPDRPMTWLADVVALTTPLKYGVANVLVFSSQSIMVDGTLKLFLNVPGAIDAFMAYLKHEHSEENLEFWLAVKQYQNKTARIGPVQSDAVALVMKYLQVNAPSQVNIPASVRRRVMKDVAVGATLTTFDECEAEILRLMEQDGFRRYTEDAAYQEFLRSTKLSNSVPHGRLVVVDMAYRIASVCKMVSHKKKGKSDADGFPGVEFSNLNPMSNDA